MQAALELLLLGADARERGPVLEELSRHPGSTRSLCGIDMADLLAVKAEIDVPISEHTADEAALGLARAGVVDVFNTGLG